MVLYNKKEDQEVFDAFYNLINNKKYDEVVNCKIDYREQLYSVLTIIAFAKAMIADKSLKDFVEENLQVTFQNNNYTPIEVTMLTSKLKHRTSFTYGQIKDENRIDFSLKQNLDFYEDSFAYVIHNGFISTLEDSKLCEELSDDFMKFEHILETQKTYNEHSELCQINTIWQDGGYQLWFPVENIYSTHKMSHIKGIETDDISELRYKDIKEHYTYDTLVVAISKEMDTCTKIGRLKRDYRVEFEIIPLTDIKKRAEYVKENFPKLREAVKNASENKK